MDLPATWQGSRNTILSPETMLPATPGRRWQNSLLPAVNSNFIFAAYVDQAFPVSDTFFADKTFFENYSSYQKPVFLFFLLCGFLFLAAFVWLTAIGRKKKQRPKAAPLLFWPLANRAFCRTDSACMVSCPGTLFTMPVLCRLSDWQTACHIAPWCESVAEAYDSGALHFILVPDWLP